MLEEYLAHSVKVYGAYLDDDNDIFESASGGVSTAMARNIINSGGIVFGVAYTDDYLDAEYIKATNILELKRLRGSKVFDVNLNDCFHQIQANLKEGKTVLFFGLPCLCAALLKYLHNDYENLIRCELVCSGRVSRKIHFEYCKHLIEKYKSPIVGFTVRGKIGGWLPEYLIADFKNGRQFSIPFKRTEYGQGFKIFKEDSCINCKYKLNSQASGDIMIGDFWGFDKNNPYYHPNGMSVVFIETQKGYTFFKALNGIIKFETSFAEAVKENMSVIKSGVEHPERQELMPILKKRGLFAAMKKSSTMKHIKIVNQMCRIPGCSSLYAFIKRIKRQLSYKDEP